MDYSTWNDNKLAVMMADPLAALTSIEASMDGYIKTSGGKQQPVYETSTAQLAAER